MATLVFYKQDSNNNNTDLELLLPNSQNRLIVSGFSDGVANVGFDRVTNVEDALDVVLCCFEADSNFKQELLKFYNCDANTELKSIQLDLLDGTLLVLPTTTATDRDRLIHEYYANAPMRPSVSELCY